MRYDVALKELIPLAHVFLSKILGREQAEGLELLPVEFGTVRRRQPDLVFRSKSGIITHIELQSTNHARMALRVAGYGLDLEEMYPGTEIHHFVLYFGQESLRMPNTFISRSGAMRFECRIIDIREFSGVDLLASDSLHDNFLALLTSDIDQHQGIRQVLSKMKDLPDKQRGDALAQLLVISGMRQLEPFIEEEARSIMPVDVDLMENSVIRGMVDRARQEVREEVRAETKREDLTATLLYRFGPLPDWVTQKLQTAQLPDLERWMTQSLSAQSLDTALS